MIDVNPLLQWCHDLDQSCIAVSQVKSPFKRVAAVMLRNNKYKPPKISKRMKFKILNAEIKTVEKAGENEGNEYIQLTVAEDSMFAERSHKLLKFVPQELIPRWKEAIAENKLPSLNCQYEIVKDLPSFKSENSKEVQNSMRILVELDGDGNPRVDARKQAMEILMNMKGMTIIGNTSAPLEATDAVATPAPKGFDPVTGLPL